MAEKQNQRVQEGRIAAAYPDQEVSPGKQGKIWSQEYSFLLTKSRLESKQEDGIQDNAEIRHILSNKEKI